MDTEFTLLDDIRRRRRALGWNHHKLAREAELALNALAPMDTDTWDPKARTLAKVLAALDRAEQGG